MRTGIQILIVSSLTLNMAYGQEQADSVQSIMKELGAPQAQPVVAPVATTPPAVPAAETTPAAVAAAPVDVPAVIEVSREQYVAGDYAEARKGFEKVLIAEPGNPVARYHLEKMDKRKHRNSEESAIEAVNKAWNGMVFRDYALSANALQSLKIDVATNSVDVTSSFPEIAFPKDAYAVYRPGLSRLFVLNTAKNIEKMESIIASMDAPRQGESGQVKIETRFVEFNEGALQELGFRWNDQADGDAFNSGDWAVQDGENLFAGGLRDVSALPKPGNLNPPLTEDPSRIDSRLDNGTANRIADRFNNNSGELSLSGEIGGNAVDLLIRALDQTSGTDVLSSPSIVTLSGEKAVITVGERHFYPETYEAGETQGTLLHVKYSDFREKILGVEMEVTPVVKGNEIQMKINPKINELLSWQKFQLSPADACYTYYQYRIGQTFQHAPIIASLPVFNRREIKTEVTVASGSTVGMGGLIGEKTEAFSDRVPVLGSLPLVGRIFRSEGSRTVKRNLLIFVTASKVAPNGRILSERSYEK
jgi:type II secretory pathway component GspD/PulD (secretin)